MSDYYTFITEPILRDRPRADAIEAELKELAAEHDLTYTRHEIRDWVYFSGFNRNLGGGFYEIAFVSCRIVWVADVVGHGTNIEERESKEII